MDGTTLLTVTLFVLGGVGSLVAAIWNMQNKKIDDNHRASADRITRVEAQQKEDREKADERSATLFAKMDKLNDGIAGIGKHIEGLRADVAEKYVTKAECDRRHGGGG